MCEYSGTRQKQKQTILEILSKLKMQNEMIKNLMDKNKEAESDAVEGKAELEAALKNVNIENKKLKNLLSEKDPSILSQLEEQTTGADLSLEGMSINELKSCLEEKEQRIEQMQFVIKTLNQLTSNLKEDLNKMGDVVNEKNETIFALQLDNKYVGQKIISIDSKLDILKDRLIEGKKEFERQGDMNRELSAENQKKNERISKLEIKLNKYEKAKSVIKHLKERDTKYSRKLKKLKEYIKKSADKMTKLQHDAAEIKTKDESIAKLQVEASLMKERLKKKFSAEKNDIVGKMSAELSKQEAQNTESFQKYLSNVNAVKSKVRCSWPGINPVREASREVDNFNKINTHTHYILLKIVTQSVCMSVTNLDLKYLRS